MNPKTCKRLRRWAEFSATERRTTYNHTPRTTLERAKARLGIHHPDGPLRLDPSCLRGFYQSLKKEARRG